MNIGNRFNPFNIFVGSFIPNALMKYTGISSGAKLTWARLSQFAGQDGRCYPKQETLAGELGVSISAIKRYLRELENKRFLQKENPKGQDRYMHKTIRYFFLWHNCFEAKREPCDDLSAQSKSDLSSPLTSDLSAQSKSDLSKERESKKRESIKRESEEKSALPKSKTLFSTNQDKSPSPLSGGTPPPQISGSAPNIPSNNKIPEINPNIPDQPQTPGKSKVNPVSEGDSTISQITISNPPNNTGMRLVELFCKERNGCFSDVPPPNTKRKQEWVLIMDNIIKGGYKPGVMADVIKFIFNNNDPFWRGRIAVPAQLRENIDTIVQQMAAKIQEDKKKAENRKSREFVLK